VALPAKVWKRRACRSPVELLTGSRGVKKAFPGRGEGFVNNVFKIVAGKKRRDRHRFNENEKEVAHEEKNSALVERAMSVVGKGMP